MCRNYDKADSEPVYFLNPDMQVQKDCLSGKEGEHIVKKVRRVLLCMFPLMLLLCSCKQEGAETSWEAVVGLSGCMTYTDSGVVNTAGTERGIAYFYDHISGQIVALCTKSNCEHQGLSHTNPTPDCDGFLGAYADCAAIVGGHLYYVTQEEFSWDKPEGLFHKYLYRAETDGTNRKEIAHFSDAQSFCAGNYGEGYFVYSYHNDSDLNGEALEQECAGVYLVDLQNDEMKQIMVESGYEAAVSSLMIYKSRLYYFYSYMKEYMDFNEDITDEYWAKICENSCGEIWCYDIETGEAECLWKDEGSVMTVKMGDGTIYIGQDDSVTVICCDNGKSVAADKKDFFGKYVMPYGQRIYLLGEGKLHYYDVKTGKISFLGTYDTSKIQSIEAITDEMVYLWSDELRSCLSYEDFSKGKLDKAKKIDWDE